MTGLALGTLALSTAFVGYTLVGYPALLGLNRLWRQRGRESQESDEADPIDPEDSTRSAPDVALPNISITLPAYNEEAQIRAAIESLLAATYPKEKRQILIVSDGSTDRTDEIVREFADEGVELLRVEGRRGKSAVENEARRHLRGDIIVNTDASVRLGKNALMRLVASFADPRVGVASGRDVSMAPEGTDTNAGEGGYVGYEMWVRDLETEAGGIVGASGCLYAIRRELHETPVPGELSRDFSSALIARERGYRAVSVPNAVCHVPRATSLRREYPRKVRTIARGLRTLFARRELMNPSVHGAFAWMLLSHKLFRWLMPWALVVASASLLFLAGTEGWARWLAGGGVLLVLAAGAGWLWPERRDAPVFLSIPAYFVVGNLATLHAWARYLGGRKDAVWEPTRRPAAVAVHSTGPTPPAFPTSRRS